jgi:hypothetical protein
LNTILNEKKAQVEKVAALSAARTIEIDAKAIMLGGLLPKELLAGSEQAYREQQQHRQSDAIALPVADDINEQDEADFNIYKNIFNR